MGEPFFWPKTKNKALQAANCRKCGLHKTCKTPRMEPTGKGEKGWLVVAEAPGETEDEQGIQLVGRAGKLFRKKLMALGLSLKRDFRKTNAVCCHPPGNRTPTGDEISACRGRLFDEVNRFKPKAVFLLGQVAIESWWGERLGPVGKMTKWRGFRVPDRNNRCWVFHLFHPSYVLRARNYQPVVETIFDQDLKQAVSWAEEPFPLFVNESALIEVLEDRRKIIQWLRKIPAGELVVVDWETTGLKPWNAGHHIVCAGVSYGNGTAAFPMEDRRVRLEVKKLLERRDIYLAAHHIQFEDMWARKCLGANPKWAWDSMLAAHVLDNRDEITGLKWQAFIRYGVLEYDSEVKPWLKSGSNGFNQLPVRMKDPQCRRKILLYVGMDALFGRRLALDQMEDFDTWPWERK